MTKFKIEDGQEVKIEGDKEYRLKRRYNDIPKIYHNDYHDIPMTWTGTICLWIMMAMIFGFVLLWPLMLGANLGKQTYPVWHNFP